MIVSIGLGDEGVNVCLDDGIGEYNPLRLVEMTRVARELFAGCYIDTLVATEPETGPQAEGVEQ